VMSSNRCPRCGAEVVLGDSEGGSTVACKDCGKEMRVLPGRSFMPSAISALAVFGVIFFAIWMMLPTVNSNSGASLKREKCNNNLKQLAVAMHHYHERNGCFPPAFVADKNGKPMHSWRALLLPFLEGVPQDLVAKYNFDEPWDSVGNRKVTDVPLAVYHCPSEPSAKEPTTSYMMVVGLHTISDGPHSRRGSDITDGFSNTIMLVEVADSGVGWAEPKDLDFDKIDFKINGKKRPGISSQHSDGAFIALGDGSVRFIVDATKPELIKAMLTIDGGEKIPGDGVR
jgi:hypothetical protein